MIKFSIGYNNALAKVSSRGQLVTAPLDFSEAYTATASVDDTAANIIAPKTNSRFVITDMILDSDQNVSPTTPGTVIVYEALSDTTATVTKSIVTLEMTKNQNRIITGINLILTEGRWLNIKTTDNNVRITVMGYYVNA